MKFVIVSNRLPVTLAEEGDSFVFRRSGGGLATGLDSLRTEAEKHWIGWPGLHIEEPEKRDEAARSLKEMGLHPVFLSEEQIEKYYEGFSNSTLWPLCHYFLSYIQYEPGYWRTYKEVNALFCREVLKVIRPGDFVWVHDYQLMLLPGMIREHAPDVGIGFFHHIPFPSYEMFRCLPQRAEILRGLLGADLIGFHTHDYMRHFISAAYRVLGVPCHLDEVLMRDRVCRLDAYPMGINYDLYRDTPATVEARSFAEELRGLAGDSKIILSIDRLDYTKGIPTRLRAYAEFLENNPEFRGRVTLVMVVVPSRDNVEMYAELKTEIDTLIGHINGQYADVGWMPIHYFYRSFDLSAITAMYKMADVALVTPLRDGMNLVAKEFVASKREKPGVLILSEMAGAAVELTEALIVNPTDVRQIEDAIRQALAMDELEQTASLRRMQKKVRTNDVYKWARDFFAELKSARERNIFLHSKLMDKDNVRQVAEAYKQAKKRLLVLDYDGTLAPICRDPAMAVPSEELHERLRSLAQDPRNKVVICSGRDKNTLERWLGCLPVGLTAEHGMFYREGGIWHTSSEAGEGGPDPEILDIMEQITAKTPGSRVERKQAGLVWHYRDVDAWLADLRVSQLLSALLVPAGRLGLTVSRGRRIVEVKPSEANKGREVERLMAEDKYDFILAMGDDVTDEDMFAALPASAVSIKIGPFSESARYFMPDQTRVLHFLAALEE